MSSAIRKIKRNATKKFMDDIKIVNKNKHPRGRGTSFFAQHYKEYELQMKQAMMINAIQEARKNESKDN